MRIPSVLVSVEDMSFSERHPWIVQPVNPPLNYIPRRFSNQFCAAHSLVRLGPKAAVQYHIMHVFTNVTYNWYQCVQLNEKAEAACRL